MADRASPANERTRDSANVPNFESLLPGERAETHVENGLDVAPSDTHRTDISPLTPSESATTIKASQDSDLQNVEERLSMVNMDDLMELETEAFPETATERSATESKTGYPASGPYSSLAVTSFPESLTLPVSRIMSDTGNFPSTLEPANTAVQWQTVPHYSVDLRGKQSGLYNFTLVNIRRFPGQGIETAAASHFACVESDVFKVQRTRHPRVQLLIIGPPADTLQFIVNDQLNDAICCLSVRREMTFKMVVSLCQRWLDHFPVQHSPAMCLLYRAGRLETPEVFRSLSNFEELEFVRPEGLTLRFLYRLSQRSEKILYVDCNDTDYVWEVKQKFLEFFMEEESVDCKDVNANNLWLTSGERVLSNNDLLRNVLVPREDLAYTLDSQTGGNVTASDTFYVHFQSADAVLVKLNFKADSRKYGKSESFIVISPGASALDLRKEVSKVIHKEPLSFKMFISGKKIEMNMDLRQFLTSANCTVVVEQRQKICLNVENGSGPQREIAVAMHKYDQVKSLKQHVCSKMAMHSYCVDLHHRNQPLNEETDLRSSRIRHGDTIKAVVRPHRIRVSIRLASSLWEDVVVEDITISTVKQLKVYAQSILTGKTHAHGIQQSHNENSCPRGSIVFKAILNGKLLQDDTTLREAGVGMNARVLMIEVENLCYTAANYGRVPVFFCHAKEDYRPPQRVMVMSDGKNMYLRSAQNEPVDEPMLFQVHAALPDGIGPCHPHLQYQFPARQLRNPQPLTSSVQGRSICCMCKSKTFPMLSNYHQENEGMSRSLSSSFQREGSSQKLDVSFNAPRHSTPVKSEQTESQMETSLDHCDGLSPDGSGARPKGSMPNASMSASTPPSQLQHSHHSAYLAPEKMKVGSSPYPLEVQNHSIDSSGVSQDHVTAAPQQLQATQSSTSHFPDDRVGSRKDGRYQLPPSLKLPRDPNQDYNGGGVPQGRAANRPGSGMFPTPSAQFLSADTAKPPFFKSEGRSRHHSEYCSESEASQYRTVMRREFNMQESVEQDKEGHLKSTFKYEGSQKISPELLKTCTTFDSFSRTLQASHPQLALTGDERPADCPRFQCPDPTFKYIKKDTLNMVAERLGSEGLRVMYQLLDDNIVNEIKERYPNDCVDRHYECLKKWCQRNGKDASVKQLTAVLSKCGRQDLADEVERIEAKEQGYETAP